jgi:hypothetical protein
MKKYLAVLSLAILCFLGVAALTTTRAAVEPVAPATFQYANIQWGRNGPSDVYVVRPDGKAEFYAGRLAREKAPEGCSEPLYFRSLVMNLLGKEGYELAGMTDAEIVMKRAERR